MKKIGVKKSLEKFKANVTQIMQTIKQIAQDDRRRITHCIKVGIALTLMYLFYYFKPGDDVFGPAGMFAVLTVIVVFEFTVGGTISKFINRGCATLLAGALGVGVGYVTSNFGEKGEPIALGLFVFLLAAIFTFTRFIPIVKKRYDYGVTIFILTFTLVAVSGSQVGVHKILQMAHRRLSTVLIGGATCMVISILLCPVWAGQDLHELIARNIEKLSDFVQGFGDQLCSENGEPYIQGYKTALNSQTTEESLANFAWWEPRHGQFKFRHPWNTYLKIGTLTRECVCQIEALHALLNTKSPHDQVASELQLKIQSTSTKISTESSKALKVLSASIKDMRADQLLAAQIHLENSKSATNDLNTLLENSSLKSTKVDLYEIMKLLIVAHIIIKCMEKIFVSVDELFQKTCFGKAKSTSSPDKQQQQIIDCGVMKPIDVVIEISAAFGDTPESEKLQHKIETVDDIGQCDDSVVIIEISEALEDLPENKKLQREMETIDDIVPCDDPVHIIEISN